MGAGIVWTWRLCPTRGTGAPGGRARGVEERIGGRRRRRRRAPLVRRRPPTVGDGVWPRRRAWPSISSGAARREPAPSHSRAGRCRRAGRRSPGPLPKPRDPRASRRLLLELCPGASGSGRCGEPARGFGDGPVRGLQPRERPPQRLGDPGHPGRALRLRAARRSPRTRHLAKAGASRFILGSRSRLDRFRAADVAWPPTELAIDR